MVELVITNAHVVTLDSERQVFPEGAIAISGQFIESVGPSAQILSGHPNANVLDARKGMVLPGFVDAHCHPAQYLAAGMADDTNIVSWLFDHVMPYEALITEDEAYLSSLGCLAACLKSGITCFSDPGGEHPSSTARAAIDIGIRGIVSQATADVYNDDAPMPTALIKTIDANLLQSKATLDQWNNVENGRIKASLAMRYVFDVTDELCRQMKICADEHGVLLHLHAAAVKGENDVMLQRKGKRTLAWLHELGLFGENLVLAHVGFASDAEIKLLDQFNVKVVHCPTASMMGGYGVIAEGQIPKMLAAGITVGLGTDAAAAGGHHDMIRTMYLAACAHKDIYADATLVGAQRALEMATIEGAKVCQWDTEIGSLEPGKKADLIIVDRSTLDWHPGRTPINDLVYSSTGSSVDTVMVDGNIVVQDRRLITLDEVSLQGRLDTAYANVMERLCS